MERSWKNGVEWTEKEEIKESLREAVRAVCLSHLLSLSLVRPPWRLEAQGEQSTRGIERGNSALPSKQDLLRAVESLLTSHSPSLSPSLPPSHPCPPSLPLTHSFHPSNTTRCLLLLTFFFFFSMLLFIFIPTKCARLARSRKGRGRERRKVERDGSVPDILTEQIDRKGEKDKGKRSVCVREA